MCYITVGSFPERTCCEASSKERKHFFHFWLEKNGTLDSAKLGPVKTVLQQFQGYYVHLKKQIPILELLYQVHSKVYSEVTAELTFLFCQAHS